MGAYPEAPAAEIAPGAAEIGPAPGQAGGLTGAVLVLGAGIGGMQAALDLANSGFLVHLATRESSIGGKMTQLDKTFPTNECAMCLLGPRMSDCRSHPNIVIHTLTELGQVQGQPGRFRVTLRHEPRYIDAVECTGCGDCEAACPVKVPNEFNQGLGERRAIHRLFPQAVPSAYAITKRGTPPCRATCPAGTNAQGYIALISEGKFAEALEVVRRRMPFPGVCGRICQHPCEEECNRAEYDEPVAIQALKRAAWDHGWAGDAAPAASPLPAVAPAAAPAAGGAGQAPPVPAPAPPAPCAEGKVAVVGAGPAGLTAAADLRALGWQVTVFEASDRPGGQMALSIPRYRLPDEVVRRDVDHLLGRPVAGTGSVELRCGVRVGKDVSLADLRRDYRAVLLAVGLHVARGLPLDGVNAPNVHLALDFLKAAWRGEGPDLSGQRVLVIGGGAVAMDAACSALRLGAASVEAACLESRAEMPAHSWEIEEALEEGVTLGPSWGPKRLNLSAGRVASVTLQRCVSVFDEKKRFNPVYDPATEREVPCESVILAIGQGLDPEVLGAEPERGAVRTRRGGTIEADPLTHATSAAGVFCCGEAASGPGSVVEAVGHAHEAAVSIDRYLQGEDLAAGRAVDKPAKLGPPEGRKVLVQARRRLPAAPPAERRRRWDEVWSGYSREEAVAEARRCLNCGICSECLQCEAACKKAAVRHAELPVEEEIPVGAIIAAPGFDLFDARAAGQYGYGVYPNVVTSMEFERMLSATGPTMGVVARPSDGRHPRRVAFLQCIGSREAPGSSGCGAQYCSAVCCMYSVKEAIIAREHDRSIEPTLFLLDLRAFGKGFDRYADGAEKDYGVRFVRQMVSAVHEDPVTGNLTVRYWRDAGPKPARGAATTAAPAAGEGLVEEEFDLVVLAVGVKPPAGAGELAGRLGMELGPDGFARTPLLEPNSSTRPGVFVAGGFQGPRDIPETVMNGSAAAAAAAEFLGPSRGTLVRRKEYPPERDVSAEEPRVGVFVCRCGINIASVVDVPALVDYLRAIPGVAWAQEFMFTCSQDSVNQIKETIREHRLNRVVVASCTIRTHQPLFRETLREAGLNQFLFEMANIRDQCSWVHRDSPDLALWKAKDLARMAVAKVRRQRPLQLLSVPVVQRALVVGGGPAGMTAALSFAAQGFPTYLVEKEPELGGNLRHLYRGPGGEDLQDALLRMIARVEAHPLLTVFLQSRLVEFGGHAGHFKTALEDETGRRVDLEHAVVVVATGLRERQGAGAEYLFGSHPAVVSSIELERMLHAAPEELAGRRRVVFVQCAGTRNAEREYCSRTCCAETVKNALRFLELHPEAQLTVIYRDMRTYGFSESLYRQAREAGVLFVRYEPDKKPLVTPAPEGLDAPLLVRAFDPASEEELALPADLVVLSLGMEARPDAPQLANLLKVPLNQDGFYLETHIKLGPMDFPSLGLFLCGICHAPKSLEESIYQARGAAARAGTVISQAELHVGGVVAVVDDERCAACLTCVRVCPYSVPAINADGVAQIDQVQCHGCGTCAAECPGRAITLQNYTDEQLMAKVAAIYDVAGAGGGHDGHA